MNKNFLKLLDDITKDHVDSVVGRINDSGTYCWRNGEWEPKSKNRIKIINEISENTIYGTKTVDIVYDTVKSVVKTNDILLYCALMNIDPLSIIGGYRQVLIKNSSIKQEATSRLRTLVKDETIFSEMIKFCEEYSVTLPTPNIDNFKNIAHYIYHHLSSGKSWDEIKIKIGEEL